MKDYSSVLFPRKQYIPCSKGAHQNENFWDFRVLGSNFVKFLMPILKRRVDSSPNVVSLFSFMKDYSSVLFPRKQYIPCSKGAHPNENFWDFRVLGRNFVKFLMPILKRRVDSSPNVVSLFGFTKDYSSVLFFAQTIYTLLIRSLLKWKSLRLSSAQVKICQIPYASF